MASPGELEFSQESVQPFHSENEPSTSENVACTSTVVNNTGDVVNSDIICTTQTFVVNEDGSLMPCMLSEEVIVDWNSTKSIDSTDGKHCDVAVNAESGSTEQVIAEIQDEHTNAATYNVRQSTSTEGDNIAINDSVSNNNTDQTEERNDDTHSDEEGLVRKRRKRHHVKENDWTYKKAKIAREKGQEYKGRKKTDDGKWTFCMDRPKRKMKEIKCKCKGKAFYCSLLSEKDKKNIFKDFWSLSWKEKRMYVRGITEIHGTQRARDRKQEGKSRRSASCKYFLKINHDKLRVCKATFLATLGVGDWMVWKWCKDEVREDNSAPEYSSVDEEEQTEQDKRSRTATPQEKRQSAELKNRHDVLHQFLESLPKVESHYCRATSNKLYVEPTWTSKRQLYDTYSEDWCQERKTIPLSTCTFYKSFEDLNLALYRPKKDQCDICRAYKLGQLEQSKYDAHIGRKEKARKEKDTDKLGESHVFTMDLQSLLLCPKSEASALYYRSKLSVHNFTIYDVKSNNGFCFLWNESEGGLTANEFASILDFFISSQGFEQNSNCKLIFYSDGCNYQNRNVILSNSLLYLAKKLGIIIEQKYLEKGHTQSVMQCTHPLKDV